MASEVGSAYVSILPSAKGFASNLQREIGTDLARVAKKGGEDYGKGFSAAAVDQAKKADVAGGIGADAKRAGGKAGDDYGKGFGSAATGQAKRAGADVSRAAGTDAKSGGVDAGRDFGKAFADEAVDEVEKADIGGSIGGKLKAGAAGLAGLAVGGSIVAGFGEALERGALGDKLAAQLGPGSATRKASRVSAELFAGAWGDSVEDVNAAVSSVVTNIGGMRHASQRDLKAVTTNVLDIATAFDQDVSSITRAADQLVRTNLAKGPREALDIITKGFQSGANEADDLLDTFSEYGTQFRKMGLDGAQATGLLSQGLQAGARDADIVADSIKEFSLRTVAGLTEVDSKGHAQVTDLGKAFETLGINVLAADGGVTKAASTIQTDLAGGGDKANAALDEMLDRLRNVDDPLLRSQAAVALFGTQAEDMGDALYALDPSNAVDTLGKVGGAANRMGKTLNDNAASQVESFKRSMQTNFVDFLGNKVIPAAQDLWEDVGPDVRKLGHSFSDMAEDLGPAVKAALPVVAEVIGDVAEAFGAFGRAFSSLPKPLQTAIVTAALAGYGVKKLRGVTGGGMPLLLGGGRTVAPTTSVPPVFTGGRAAAATAAGSAATRGTSAVGTVAGRTPLLTAAAVAYGFPAIDKYVDKYLDDSNVQDFTSNLKLMENGVANFTDTVFGWAPGKTGIENAQEELGALDQKIANLATSGHMPAARLMFARLTAAAREQGVSMKTLRDNMPLVTKALGGVREAGWNLLGLWRKNLLPTSKTLADRFDLDTDEAAKLRKMLGDTTGTAKEHEKQLRQVARQMGLNKQQTQELINKYGDIPKKVETRAEFLTAEAERKRDTFLTQTKGKFSDLGNETYAIMVNGQSGHGRVFAAGGFVSGPGGPRSDSINARLSNGEFVVNADATRQNRDLLESINSKKFADGGLVGRTNTKVNMNLSALREVVAETLKSLASSAASGGMTAAQVARGLAFARSQVGDPYVWGGVGPNGFDCSGFQSAIFNAARGLNPYHRLGSTGTMPWPHMAPGKGGAYQIGWFTGNPGHTAGTLGGVNVESRGGEGVVVGPNARGANDSLFNRHAHFTTAAGRNIPVSVGRGDPAFTGAGGPLNRFERWIIGRESGGRTNANNPSSSAFGLGQLLDSNRVAYAKRLGLNWHREMGDTGTTDYGAQLAMMRMYIKDRYGSARSAVNFWQQHGYYDQGGVLKPGYTMAYNGTGRDEYVTKEPPRRRGAQRIVLDAGSIGRLSGWIDDRIDGALDFEATTGRMR